MKIDVNPYWPLRLDTEAVSLRIEPVLFIDDSIMIYGRPEIFGQGMVRLLVLRVSTASTKIGCRVRASDYGSISPMCCT
jgi:hypothetical protein